MYLNRLNIQNVVAAACDARSIVEPTEKDKLVESISSAVIEILDLQVYFLHRKRCLPHCKI